MGDGEDTLFEFLLSVSALCELSLERTVLHRLYKIIRTRTKLNAVGWILTTSVSLVKIAFLV